MASFNGVPLDSPVLAPVSLDTFSAAGRPQVAAWTAATDSLLARTA